MRRWPSCPQLIIQPFWEVGPGFRSAGARLPQAAWPVTAPASQQVPNPLSGADAHDSADGRPGRYRARPRGCLFGNQRRRAQGPLRHMHPVPGPSACGPRHAQSPVRTWAIRLRRLRAAVAGKATRVVALCPGWSAPCLGQPGKRWLGKTVSLWRALHPSGALRSQSRYGSALMVASAPEGRPPLAAQRMRSPKVGPLQTGSALIPR